MINTTSGISGSCFWILWFNITSYVTSSHQFHGWSWVLSNWRACNKCVVGKMKRKKNEYIVWVWTNGFCWRSVRNVNLRQQIRTHTYQSIYIRSFTNAHPSAKQPRPMKISCSFNHVDTTESNIVQWKWPDSLITCFHHNDSPLYWVWVCSNLLNNAHSIKCKDRLENESSPVGSWWVSVLLHTSFIC